MERDSENAAIKNERSLQYLIDFLLIIRMITLLLINLILFQY